MKAYLAKGYGMDAGLIFKPKAVEAIEDPPELPEGIRGWSIRIAGAANEEVIFQGSLEDLELLVTGIRNAWIEIAKTEEGRREGQHRHRYPWGGGSQ